MHKNLVIEIKGLRLSHSKSIFKKIVIYYYYYKK